MLDSRHNACWVEAAAASGGLGEAPTHTPRQVPPPQTGLRRGGGPRGTRRPGRGLVLAGTELPPWLSADGGLSRCCSRPRARAHRGVYDIFLFFSKDTVEDRPGLQPASGLPGVNAHSLGISPWLPRTEPGPHRAASPQSPRQAARLAALVPVPPGAGLPCASLALVPGVGRRPSCSSGPGGGTGSLGGGVRPLRAASHPSAPRASGAPGGRKGQVRWGRGGTGGCDIGPLCST